MNLKELAALIKQFSPLVLIKQVFPNQKANYTYSSVTHEFKPWVNTHEVELTAQDFE